MQYGGVLIPPERTQQLFLSPRDSLPSTQDVKSCIGMTGHDNMVEFLNVAVCGFEEHFVSRLRRRRVIYGECRNRTDRRINMQT